MVRIDMSEYMEKFSVSRLIGAPPGYVGYEEGGVLTEAIRRKPYQVILLDELEKAHREVLNLMLQVFDEGRLTDSQGRLVDFRNTILIMTSNLGSKELEDEQESNRREKITEVIRAFFAPEFLNRLDEIVLFNKLSRESMDGIVNIQLQRVQERIRDRNMTLSISPRATSWLADEGYNPLYGARPLKRVIQHFVLNPMAQMILKGDLKDGSLVKIEVSQDGSNLEIVALDQSSVSTN